MSYWTIARMSQDTDLTMREAACYAQQPDATEDPTTWALAHALVLAAHPGWDAAYSGATQTNVPNPGQDPGIILDSMILAAVQNVLGTAE